MRRWEREILKRKTNSLNDYLYRPKLTKQEKEKVNELIKSITSDMVAELRESMLWKAKHFEG